MQSETEINWFDHETRINLAESLVVDLDEYCDKIYDDGFRGHLGGSVIGQECSRELWYAFRWVKGEDVVAGCPNHTKGQMRRLHQRGHRMEDEIIDYLRGIGCTVFNVDPNTGKQFRVELDGHIGGAFDSSIYLPTRYNFPWALLGEYKTHNRKSFAKLEKEGLARAKPVHLSQMNFYGYHYGFEWGMYVAINKDNDDIYIEIVKLDHTLGQMLTAKAHDIVYSGPESMPLKVTMSPTDFRCRFCSFKDICHHGDTVERNCRSCKYAVPQPGGTWNCTNDAVPMVVQIGDELMATGCEEHVGINQ